MSSVYKYTCGIGVLQKKNSGKKMLMLVLYMICSSGVNLNKNDLRKEMFVQLRTYFFQLLIRSKKDGNLVNYLEIDGYYICYTN